MNKKIVLAGAGHGHLMFLNQISDVKNSGFDVTVISPDKYHYYSGMGPGMISGAYKPEQCRFDVESITEKNGGRFIKDSITAFNPDLKQLITSSGETVYYDVVSFNTGSEMSYNPGAGENIFPVKPIVNLYEAGRYIIKKFKGKSFSSAVIGGGFAGIESACNIRYLAFKMGIPAKIMIIEKGIFLEQLNRKFYNEISKELKRIQVGVFQNSGDVSIQGNRVITESGRNLDTDIIINATGVRASSIFKDSGIVTDEEGALSVNTYLQSPQYPEVFGTGDCIHFKNEPLRKAGVYAVKQNPIIFHNLQAYLSGLPLIPFKPQKNYMAILNTGFERGILFRKPFLLRGRLPYVIKDLIDRRFIKQYQK